MMTAPDRGRFFLFSFNNLLNIMKSDTNKSEITADTDMKKE